VGVQVEQRYGLHMHIGGRMAHELRVRSDKASRTPQMLQRSAMPALATANATSNCSCSTVWHDGRGGVPTQCS